MSAQRQPEYDYSEKQYWQIEEDSSIKHEFWDGQILVPTAATPTHIDIVGNIGCALRGQLRASGYRVRMSRQRVKAGTLQTYPDVVVACRPLQYDPNDAKTLIDATVIVEVLSRSTQRKDRNLKFDRYQELPSLRHYLLVSQTPFDVEHHFKLENGEWQSESFDVAGDAVRLMAISCQLTLSEIYEDIELEDQRAFEAKIIEPQRAQKTQRGTK